MSTKLTDTVAIVTGASSGIGRSTAIELAHHGATVALLARRTDRLEQLAGEIETAGGTALVVTVDISDRARAEAAVETVVDHFGRLDILVNNAGYMILGAVSSSSPDDWDKMIAINQQGLLYITKAALPHLHQAATREPRNVADIVNISSLAGRVAFANQSVYNMTKFAVNGFTEALRQELATSHVRVGALEPGVVTSELVSHNNDDVKKDIDTFIGDIRPLDPEDIAEGVAFMVTRPWHAAVGELWIMPTEAP